MNTNYKIEFVEATKDDVKYLIDLRIQTMSEHLKNSFVNQTPEQMKERVLYRFDCAKIILINGEKAGLLKVVKNLNEWELSQIQIINKFQRKGLGEQIIRKIIHEAKQEKAFISLHVLKSNPAKRLYERLGFNTINENAHSFKMNYQ
jgi:ribosomal protein S18 acetylase RimI-like enzyme